MLKLIKKNKNDDFEYYFKFTSYIMITILASSSYLN